MFVSRHQVTAIWLSALVWTAATPSAGQGTGSGAVTISLTSSVNPAVYGLPVTITASVAPAFSAGPTPTGSVVFYDSSASLQACVQLDSAGRCSITFPYRLYPGPYIPSPGIVLGAGSHPITASYSGDSNYAAITSSALNQQITKAEATTTFASTQIGQSFLLSAAVRFPSAVPYISLAIHPEHPTDGNPTGTVQFYSGSSLIGTATLTPVPRDLGPSSRTTLTTAFAGSLTAVYSGDGNYHGSTSQAVVTGSPLQAQGGMLVGTGAVANAYGGSYQGASVAISADGNTAIVGGPEDNGGYGAAWIFTRVNGVWTQQGNKLVGTGAASTAGQGRAVALSGDGNTALVGGPGDGSAGAAWVYTRSQGVWTQQGNKLAGTGATGDMGSGQGFRIALSADGNTAAVSGQNDDNLNGAVWVFTRSGGVWTQQGPKLVSTGATNPPVVFGRSIAISADGNTLAAGGPSDNNAIGAVWVFTRSNGVWTQQGNKLVAPDAVGPAQLGSSVALSGDGSTLLVGGYADANQGAVWVFTRSNGVWTTQGNKLTGTGTIEPMGQGTALALSADGNTAIEGGTGYSSGIGTVWMFSRNNGIWTQQGGKFAASTAAEIFNPGSIAISADGKTAVVGGPNDSPSGAAWIFAQGMNAYSTVTSLSTSTSSMLEGEAVTLTATVSVNPPSALIGTVIFYDGGSSIPGGVIAVNSLTGNSVSTFTTTLGAGTHSITAAFQPAGGSLPASSSSPVWVYVTGVNVSLDMTSNVFPATVGQPVTFTVTVSAAGFSMPRGIVQFADGSTVLGTAAVVNGRATFTAVFATGGTHSIYAYYNGSAGSSAASTRFGLVVNRVGTSVTLSSSAADATFGQAVTFSAQLGPAAPAGVPSPTGPIQFYDGATVMGTAAPASGTATLTVSNLAAGVHQIYAFYGGDASWFAIRSAALVETIGRAPTSTVLSAVVSGTKVTLSVSITGSAAVKVTPSGGVHFMDADQNVVLCIVPLSPGGVVNLPMNAPELAPAGGHALTAVYKGDANFAPSSSNAMAIPILRSATGAVSPNFAPDELVSLYTSNPAGDTVKVIDSAGATRSATLYLVSERQINFVIPGGTAVGTALVTLAGANPSAGLAVLPTEITIAPVAPGIFTSGADGRGPAAGQIIRVDAAGTATGESLSAPVFVGSDTVYLELYGTGLRNRSSLAGVMCEIDGLSLPVAYAGPQGQLPGLDQVNVLLPASLNGAGEIGVVVKVDGQVSNQATLVFR